MADTVRYKDISLDFEPHPVTKDIGIKKNENCVNNSIKNLVLMNFYDSPFKPNIGSNIMNFLFEPITPVTALSMQDNIRQLITNYEPRAEIKDVLVTPQSDMNGYDVTITYNMVNVPQEITLNTFLERVR